MAATLDIAAALKRRDAGGDPERLALKYQAMRADRFAFFRATCHLFYARLPSPAALPAAPLVWACGDLHIENFGYFSDASGHRVFGVNDFDESFLAPAGWDVLRGAGSVYAARKKLGLEKDAAAALAGSFVRAFAARLAQGGATNAVQAAASPGKAPTEESGLAAAADRAVLEARTSGQGMQRRLKTDGRYALPATPAQSRLARACIAAFAAQTADPAAFEVLDVARRVAGLASLGHARFAVLARGSGEQPKLLDLKQAHPPGGAAQAGVPQPGWPGEAARVVAIERLAEPWTPPLLAAAGPPREAMVLRELQPREARLKLAALGQGAGLRKALEGLAGAAAAIHLRAAGFRGAAQTQTLADFGADAGWQAPLAAMAIDLAQHSKTDWGAFCQAFDAGEFS